MSETANEPELALYAVKNREGKWFRRKGYGGYGDTWVADFTKARIYNKDGPARGVVSYFANTWPDFGAPFLVKLVLKSLEVQDETDRVTKQRTKKQIATLAAEKRNQEYLLQSAIKAKAAAEAEIQRLQTV